MAVQSENKTTQIGVIWMNEWTNEWTNERTNKQMIKWMNDRMNEQVRQWNILNFRLKTMENQM